MSEGMQLTYGNLEPYHPSFINQSNCILRTDNDAQYARKKTHKQSGRQRILKVKEMIVSQ